MSELLFLIPAGCALVIGIVGLFWWAGKEITEENDFRDYERGEPRRFTLKMRCIKRLKEGLRK